MWRVNTSMRKHSEVQQDEVALQFYDERNRNKKYM